jgi:YD repeat-containing protein
MKTDAAAPTDATDRIEYRYNYTNTIGASKVSEYTNGVAGSYTNYNYDSLGKLLRKYSVTTGYTADITNEYDKTGKLTLLKRGGTSEISTRFTYSSGLLEKVQTNGSAVASVLDSDNATYAYRFDGKVTMITYPKLSDGTYLTTSYNYDDINNTMEITNKKGTVEISKYLYIYDKNGNIVSVTSGSNTTNYSYDKLNRLVGVSGSGGSGGNAAYTYDLQGNRITTNDNKSMSMVLENFTLNGTKLS